MVLCLWPWLTSKRIMWVCQHHLSFLFCYMSPLISFACIDRPLTFVYNTLHYYDRRLQDRAALKRKLVSVIVGTICRKSVFFSVHEHYYYYYLQFCLTGIFSRDRVPPGHGKSWNLGRLFSRPGKSWKIAKVMESHGKVMENDDNIMVFLLLHWAIM